MANKPPLHQCKRSIFKKSVFAGNHEIEYNQNPVANFCCGQVAGVDATFIHPNYKDDVKLGFDIAVLKLEEPIYNISTPRLPELDYFLTIGRRVVVLGWGEMASGLPAQILQMGDRLTVVSSEHCKPKKNKDLLCLHALGKNSGDTCKGTRMHDDEKRSNCWIYLELNNTLILYI